MRSSTIAAMMMMALAACSGGSKKEATGPGDKHAGDLDVGDGKAGQPDAGAAGATRMDAAPSSTGPAPTGALVTFRLRNSHPDTDLVFSMDKGWQPILFGFSGKPPKAKGVMLFPMHCTASCDSAEDARCPYCPKPKKNKKEQELEKREVVAAGKYLDVPWDGNIYVYEKTRGRRDGKRRKCSCWKKQPIPAESYTIRACGFRLTDKAAKRSKYECRDAKVSLPPDKPTVVDIEFKG